MQNERKNRIIFIRYLWICHKTERQLADFIVKENDLNSFIKTDILYYANYVPVLGIYTMFIKCYFFCLHYSQTSIKIGRVCLDLQTGRIML